MLFHVTSISVFYLKVVLVWLSVPVQVIDWKDSSEVTYNVLMGDVKPYSLYHSLCVCVCVCMLQYGEIYNFPEAVFEKVLEDEEMHDDTEAVDEESESEREDEEEV